MIRNLLLPVLFILGTQLHAQKLFDLGVKAGISRDNMRLENVADHTAVTGWHLGAFLRVKPPLAPGVQAEVLYTTMGTDAQPLDTLDGNSAIRLNYLQVPFFLVFSLGPAELHLGGYASHLLNASITQPLVIHNEVEQLREDEFLDTDYGLLAGAGLRLGRIYVGARYTFGLGTIGGSDNIILRDARNLQAQLYLAYGFNK